MMGDKLCKLGLEAYVRCPTFRKGDSPLIAYQIDNMLSEGTVLMMDVRATLCYPLPPFVRGLCGEF
jgi:hypothetical protein